MADSVDAAQIPRLSDLFDEVFSSYRFLEDCEEPSNAEPIQTRMQSAIEKCVRAVQAVNQLGLFSSNESLEEVSTNEIRYILLPAFMGYFTLRSNKGARMDLVKKAKVYFTDYLRLCKLYNATNVEIPEFDAGEEHPEEEDSPPKGAARSSRPPDQATLARMRQTKIERFKLKKANEQLLRDLYAAANREHVDDEVKREYYIKLLEQWVITSLEELESIENELQMLEHMQKFHGKNAIAEKPKVKPPPMRPFIITKNSLQKQVFGLGYPSIPTVTVEEYYLQQVARGVFPDEGTAPRALVTQEEREEQGEEDKVVKELKLDRDDADTLRRAREWDDWKDNHRTGWGNTKNMG